MINENVIECLDRINYWGKEVRNALSEIDDITRKSMRYKNKLDECENRLVKLVGEDVAMVLLGKKEEM